MNRRIFLPIALGLTIILVMLAGCSSLYYSTYEKFGVYKRDLLKKRVAESCRTCAEHGCLDCTCT